MSKMCASCPFNIGNPACDEAFNLGCLPSGYEVREMYEKQGKVWMCHSNESKVCEGLKEDQGEALKTNGKTIQTYSSWYRGED